jgi:hypothetical protein
MLTYADVCSGERDSDSRMPLFYARSSEQLGDMARAKTPEDKALAVAAAARSILLCLDQQVNPKFTCFTGTKEQILVQKYKY